MAELVEYKGEKIELMDSERMLFIYNDTKPVSNWILDTFYPNKKTFEGVDEVDFGKLKTKNLVAPFVTADAKSRQIGGSASYSTYNVPAAYLKPSHAITPSNVHDQYVLQAMSKWRQVDSLRLKRNKLTEAEKLRLVQMANMFENRKSIDNRKTLMALDVLFKGFTEYESEDFPYIKADFIRDPNLTHQVLNSWSDENTDVNADLQLILGRMFDVGGVQPRIILSTSKAYNTAYNNPSFKERFTKADGTNTPDSTLMPSVKLSEQPMFKGSIDDIQWWVWDAKHDLYGVEQHYIDPDMIYFIADMNGTQCQCQIKHLDVLGAPLEYYDYVDVSKNPSIIEQICDSAPLMAPSTSNGVMSVKITL